MRDDGTCSRASRYWTAWNEPNLTIGLVPQWKRVGGHWVIQSAIDYARICNAVVDGVHGTLSRASRSRAATRPARQQRADERAADDLAARVPARDEEAPAPRASTPTRTTRIRAARAETPTDAADLARPRSPSATSTT